MKSFTKVNEILFSLVLESPQLWSSKKVFHLPISVNMRRQWRLLPTKRGGYIVFGIKDNPREFLGIDRNQFDTIDQAKLTEGLNAIFQPALEWDITVYEWNGVAFGIIYTFSSPKKPVMATKNYGSEIKDGEIYYRYRARSEKIRYSELRQLLEDQIEAKNNAWRRVFEQTASIDPMNVAVMDTLSGQITGGGGTVVIDEALLPKLKFIREGDFSQQAGAPTLKLIGDLQPVPVAAIRARKVVVGTDIYVFRPGQVAERVQDAIGKEFGTGMHIKAWKMYGPRPRENQPGFKSEFAEFKQAENTYRYSQAWIDYLISKLSSVDEYQKLVAYRG